MLNKVILMGRLTRDPELRYTQNIPNVPVANFTLAVDRGRKDANGNRQADFIDCAAWGRQAVFVKEWFQKGMLMIACGRLQTRTWQDKDGKNHKAVEAVCDEVDFGESKAARERAQQAQSPESGSYMPPNGSDFTELSDDESDVPLLKW